MRLDCFFHGIGAHDKLGGELNPKPFDELDNEPGRSVLSEGRLQEHSITCGNYLC